MKNSFLKFGFVASLCLVLVGCENNDDISDIAESLDTEETALSAKADQATEALSDLVLQAYEGEEAWSKLPVHPYLPDCVTISIEINNTSKTVTVDFGTEGCEVRGGHVVKGKMIITYQRDADEMSKMINYSLEGFSVDGIQIEGSKTVTRQRANENGNPQYTMSLDLTITFEDGRQASRTGAKTREWIEGAFTGNWGDNVFLITGAWETNFTNGNTHSTAITIPLRREASCRFLVSGVMQLVRTNFSGTLDYGDGNCDNLAIFINENGEEREIRL